MGRGHSHICYNEVCFGKKKGNILASVTNVRSFTIYSLILKNTNTNAGKMPSNFTTAYEEYLLKLRLEFTLSPCFILKLC